MMTIDGAFAQTMIQLLGWTLLHFTWQGTLVAILMGSALALLRRHSARARYTVAMIAMLLMLALPVATFLHLSRASQQSVGLDETMSQSMTTESALSSSQAAPADDQMRFGSRRVADTSALSLSAPLRERIGNGLASLLPWLVFVWLGGVSILSIRLLGGWKRAQRLRNHGTKPLPERWQASLARLARQVGVSRQVALYESALVEVPTVIGWLRPVILVPASALMGLSPWHLEALLAHELAHVRRHDYLINLLQTATEILLFYHPAVWWVSGQMRVERENDCDDLAVAATGDALVYVRALAEIEGLRLRPDAAQLALAADAGSLLTRIRRLVEGRPHQPGRFSPLLAGVVILATFFCVMAGARTILSGNTEKPGRAVREEMEPEEIEIEEREPLAVKAANETARFEFEIDESTQGRGGALIASDETVNEDASVRRVALAALGKHAGTVVVMDPQTGQVHAIVNQEWALRSGWNPASIIKLVTGLAAIDAKLIEPSQRLRISPKSLPVDLSEALATSNTKYFEYVGERVGFERFMDYARRLGLGERTGIDYEGEIAGRLPVNQTGVDVGRLCAYGDGLQVTPIQLATLVSAIANGGTLLAPRVKGAQQDVARSDAQVRRRLDVPQETLQQLASGMSAAVRYGTARPAYNAAQTVAGKTGTGFDQNTRMGLFASYAPVDKPRLVVVVAIRGAEENGSVAAGVAGEIYRALRLGS
jgi:beta-lactamase regulating signal transducer with metallopeptidase domain/beta-lactamase class D